MMNAVQSDSLCFNYFESFLSQRHSIPGAPTVIEFQLLSCLLLKYFILIIFYQ